MKSFLFKFCFVFGLFCFIKTRFGFCFVCFVFVPHLMMTKTTMMAVMAAETPAGIGDGVGDGTRVGGCHVALAARVEDGDGVGRRATGNAVIFGAG